MKIRKALTTLTAIGAISLAAACGTGAADTTAATSSAATSSSSSATTDGSATTDSTTMQAGPGAGAGGPGDGVDVGSVSTEAELVALVQDAYGDASLDRHRGHRPVEDVLDEVLVISHEELHVRMDAGQNLAEVAEDLDIDPQTLIDALVASRSTAIDTLVSNGTLTDAQAEQYLVALEDAFTFRVTWNGSDETPTFAGIDA